jgi:hypothetical protein
MSYEKSVKRLTIPLETSQHIRNAVDHFKELHDIFTKISRSPNSERNKIHIAQYEIMSMNHKFKHLGNGDNDEINKDSYYKKST